MRATMTALLFRRLFQSILGNILLISTILQSSLHNIFPLYMIKTFVFMYIKLLPIIFMCCKMKDFML